MAARVFRDAFARPFSAALLYLFESTFRARILFHAAHCRYRGDSVIRRARPRAQRRGGNKFLSWQTFRPDTRVDGVATVTGRDRDVICAYLHRSF